MKLTNQERLDLYDSIKSELLKGKETEDQLCEKYATKHSLDKEFVKDVYLTMEEEMAQLQERFEKMLAEGIKKSKEKAIELSTATSTKAREFEDWEEEIISTAMLVRPMPKATLAKYLADVMPHRTWNAYNAHMNRAEKKAKTEKPAVVALTVTDNQKQKPETVTVVKIMEKGAIVTSKNNEKGMLHISEITSEFVSDIHDYVYVGQQIKAIRYTDFDKRVAFSAKQYKDLPKISKPVQEAPKVVKMDEENLMMLLDMLIIQSEKNLNDLKEFRKKAEFKLSKLEQLEEIKLKLNMLL